MELSVFGEAITHVGHLARDAPLQQGASSVAALRRRLGAAVHFQVAEVPCLGLHDSEYDHHHGDDGHATAYDHHHGKGDDGEDHHHHDGE